MRQTVPLSPTLVSLVDESLQVVVSPCWGVALPDIISAILAQALGPLPRRAPRVLTPTSSPEATASHYVKHAWRSKVSLQSSFHREPNFGAAVIR